MRPVLHAFKQYLSFQLKRALKFGTLACALLFVFSQSLPSLFSMAAQPITDQWSTSQQIPEYASSTNTPVLVADPTGLVHAFSAQPYRNSLNNLKTAVYYNQWSQERGWTKPLDIMLAPLKGAIIISDAFIDETGLIHLIFISGDNTNANVYYTSAPASSAYNPKAWSPPIIIGDAALVDSGAAFMDNDYPNQVVLYCGDRDGSGVYSTTSSDGGETWSRPAPIYLTNSDGLIPYGVQIYSGKDQAHAVWNVITTGGQGREIYYSRFDKGKEKWISPIALTSVSTGYGALFPTVIEYKNEIFVLYIATPKIMMVRSQDNGSTWGNPVSLFQRHIGVNGSLSMVVDSSETLHLFFGQRIPGNPDIHGMWHSVWTGMTWLEPEAIVSGPRIMSGNASFDPFNARAVVSHGNVILDTWRTDPGNGTENENGVWYSYIQLNTPKTIGKALVTPPANDGRPTITAVAVVATALPTATLPVENANKPESSSSLTIPILAGVVPVFAIVFFFFIRLYSKVNRQD